MLNRLTLSGRLLLMNLLVSGVALLLASVAFLLYDQASYRDNQVRSVSTVARMLATSTSSALVFDDPITAERVLATLSASPRIRSAAVYNGDGQQFAVYRPSDAEAPTLGRLQTTQQDYEFRGKDLVLSSPIMLEEKAIGTIVLQADMRELDQRLLQYVTVILAVLGVSLLVALILSQFYRSSVAAPITQLAETARVVSKEKDYSIRVPQAHSRDEVRVLVDAFNEMLEQIHSRDQALQDAFSRLEIAHSTARLGDWQWDLASGAVTLSTATLAHHDLIRFDGTIDAWLTAVHPEDRPRLEAALAKARQSGSDFEADYRVTSGEESHPWVLIKGVVERSANGEPTKVAGVSMDITRIKRAQEALLRSEKLAAAGRLAASIAHEINNPLEGVTNLVYLISHHSELPAELRTYVSMAEQELARVAQITTQTLRFYRQASNPTNADLNALFDSVLTLLRNRLSGVEVVKDFRGPASVHCYEGEVRQVFTNLVSNALDAMRGTGKLILRTRRAVLPGSEEPGVRITIADTGSGIPKDVLRNLFEPFYSTKGHAGTGLGLWVSRQIIEKHQGTISVHSCENRGTAFSIVIPLRVAAVQPTKESSQNASHGSAA